MPNLKLDPEVIFYIKGKCLHNSIVYNKPNHQSIITSIKEKFPQLAESKEQLHYKVKYYSQKVNGIIKTPIYQSINVHQKSKTLVLTVSRHYFSERSLLDNTVFLTGMERFNDKKVYYTGGNYFGSRVPFHKDIDLDDVEGVCMLIVASHSDWYVTDIGSGFS